MDQLKNDNYALMHFGYDLLKQVLCTDKASLNTTALMKNARKSAEKACSCVNKLKRGGNGQ